MASSLIYTVDKIDSMLSHVSISKPNSQDNFHDISIPVSTPRHHSQFVYVHDFIQMEFVILRKYKDIVDDNLKSGRVVISLDDPTSEKLLPKLPSLLRSSWRHGVSISNKSEKYRLVSGLIRWKYSEPRQVEIYSPRKVYIAEDIALPWKIKNESIRSVTCSLLRWDSCEGRFSLCRQFSLDFIPTSNDEASESSIKSYYTIKYVSNDPRVMFESSSRTSSMRPSIDWILWPMYLNNKPKESYLPAKEWSLLWHCEFDQSMLDDEEIDSDAKLFQSEEFEERNLSHIGFSAIIAGCVSVRSNTSFHFYPTVDIKLQLPIATLSLDISDLNQANKSVQSKSIMDRESSAYSVFLLNLESTTLHTRLWDSRAHYSPRSMQIEEMLQESFNSSCNNLDQYPRGFVSTWIAFESNIQLQVLDFGCLIWAPLLDQTKFDIQIKIFPNER